MMKRIHYRLNLVDPFGIARSTRTHMDVVLVHIDGGWGESSPNPFYDENPDTVDAALDQLEGIDLGDLDYIEDIEHIIAGNIHGNQSAKAAIDIALYDRFSRNLGIPLYKLFGKQPPRDMMTSFTIGIDETGIMLQKVEKARDYDILKIKLGKDLQQDLEVMAEIRKAVGDKKLRVDANGGWTFEQAIEALPRMADLGVEYVEQPLVKGSHEQLRELKGSSPLPLFVDEDSMTAADLPKLAGIVDGINIKLMKSGGLTEARRMIALARTFDFQIMLGCMIETSIAISAAAHLAPFADYLDLDGNLLISNDPFRGVQCDAAGRMALSDAPGLGIQCADPAIAGEVA